MAWQLPDASGTSVEIVVKNPNHCSAAVVDATFDGGSVRVTRGEARVPLLRDGGAHLLEITLGPSLD